MRETNPQSPERLRLKGNDLLALADPGKVWTVEEGTLTLFGVVEPDARASGGGSIPGRRRFLFEVGPGDLLCGIAPGASGCAVIVVALEPCVLRRVELSGAADDAAARGQGLAIRQWVRKWRECLGLEADGAGEAAPVWGSTAGSAEALSSFHDHCLDRLREVEQGERSAARARLDARERESRRASRRAVDDLVSVFDRSQGDLPHGADLYVAASAVGRAQGLELVQPPDWEDRAGLASPIQAIARASHVRIRRVLLHDQWWMQDCGPLLAFTGEGGRPVALLPRSSNRYELFDPATNRSTPVGQAEAESLQPEAYFIYRPLPQQAFRALELIRFAMRGRSRDVWTIVATGVAATLLGMFTPQATALLVDHAIPNSDTGLLLQIGLGLLAAAAGSALFRFSQGLAMMRLQTAADAVTQPAVWDRLLGLQLSFFRKFSTGDLQSRVTAISQIRDLLGGTAFRTLFGGVILLLNFGLLLYYSPSLALLAAAIATLSALITVSCGVLILRCVRKLLDLRGRFFGLMVQLINGVAKLRVAAAEERAFARWASEYSSILKLEARQLALQDLARVLNVSVSSLGAILLFALTGALFFGVGPSGISTGIFLAFHVAFGTFVGAVVSVSDTVIDVLAISILKRERARPILEALPEVNETKADPGQLAGRLELNHVSFRYQKDGPITLDDVSIRVEEGQFVALVGPSGSGKSTILRLLLGFESPQSGSIFIDGQDLSGIDVHAVRRQLGVVLQAGRINTGSIYDNIACNAQITLDDAWVAARATGFAKDIEAMPMGMHTVISEGGGNISGGQRQRLLLTRALVREPAILMLDEATSALDNETQAIVSQSLERLNVTRVVVAHRLSTIRNADRIYVIDAGRVVEQGSFDELAETKGLFSRLMARQMT